MPKNKIRLKDIKSIFLFSISFPLSFCLKFLKKDIWLLSERPNEARDNGYVLYKYIQEHTSKKNVYYLIKKNSSDFLKLKQYNNVIYYNSLKHYVYYLATKFHISAHVDSDSPNSRISNFLETHGLLKNKRVFLQHGITKDKISFGYYSVCRADLFVCAAEKEYEFCKKEFGFPEGNVQLLGFPRFDNLWNFSTKHQILLMPTWRSWLANKSHEEFVQSQYFKQYNSLLNDDNLLNILEQKNIDLLFLPHSDMQKFINCFEVRSKRVKIQNFSNIEIQKLIKESMMLITDYSSIAFDFAYMNKPLVYYQFDYQEYRKNQHPEGYFSYEDNGFGPVVSTQNELFEYVRKVSDDFKNTKKYEERVNVFFTLRDKNNCKRVFQKIIDMENSNE